MLERGSKLLLLLLLLGRGSKLLLLLLERGYKLLLLRPWQYKLLRVEQDQ